MSLSKEILRIDGHLLSQEYEPQIQKYKGRVVLRGDMVKDDSCSHATFTEVRQSQMTAATIINVTARLPGCAGQAANAENAYFQCKMEDAPKLLTQSECPDIWIRLPRHTWPKSWSSMEDTVVPIERSLYGHPLAGLLWDRQFEKFLVEHGWEKVPKSECPYASRQKRVFLSVYVGDIKLAGKKGTVDLVWKVLMKHVD